MTVGDRIKAFAKARFKTQSKLGEAVGMSEQALSNLVKSEAVPTGETLLRFAAVGVNVHWLLTGAGEMFGPSPSVDESRMGTMKRADLSTLDIRPADPTDPLYSREIVSEPEEIAALILRRVLAVQERQQEELRRTIEETVEELARR